MPDTPPQPRLFDDDEPTASPGPGPVEPAVVDEALRALARALGPQIRLGTSSWHFPGWRGLVWSRPHPAAMLSRHGLAAYARHPLLRCVSLDRAFYRALELDTCAALASQVDADFRFVVKAPAQLTDASLRDPATGQVRAPNPGFLDPTLAADLALRAAAQGMGSRLGVLVLQVSPVGAPWLDAPRRFLDLLHRCLQALARHPDRPDGTRIGVELRDPALLTPELMQVLRDSDAVYVLGLHDRMPSARDQLPMLRAQWPAPLICRWNLRRGLAYGDARHRFEPFDRLAAPDPATRDTVARVAAATASAGQPVFVTINNKAEGSAPRSVHALAEAIAAHLASAGRPGHQ